MVFLRDIHAWPRQDKLTVESLQVFLGELLNRIAGALCPPRYRAGQRPAANWRAPRHVGQRQLPDLATVGHADADQGIIIASAASAIVRRGWGRR